MLGLKWISPELSLGILCLSRAVPWKYRDSFLEIRVEGPKKRLGMFATRVGQLRRPRGSGKRVARDRRRLPGSKSS